MSLGFHVFSPCFCCADTKITVGVQESTDDINSTGNEKQTEEDPLPAALVKQEMLVQYLQDAYNFSAKITEALSMVSKLMYERSVSGRYNYASLLSFMFTMWVVCHKVWVKASCLE